MSKHIEQTNYKYLGIFLVAALMLFGLLWFIDRSGEAQPLGAAAQTATTPPCSLDIMKRSTAKITFDGNATFAADQDIEAFIELTLPKDGAPCYKYSALRVLFKFDLGAQSGKNYASAYLDVPATAWGSYSDGTSGFSVVLTNTTWNKMNGIFGEGAITQSRQVGVLGEVWYNGSEKVITTNRTGLTITAQGQANPGTGTGSGGGGTGTGTGSGGGAGTGTGTGSGGGGTGTGSGGGNNLPSGGSSTNCGQYFTLDSKTGLCIPKGPGTGDSLSNSGDVYTLASRVIRIMLTFAGIIAVIFVIIGGYMYITSAGNEEQAGKGRKTITYALIGIVVILLSFVIVSLLTKFITTGS